MTMIKKEYESAKASEAAEAAADNQTTDTEQAATDNAAEAAAADADVAEAEADNIKQQLDELQAQLDKEKKEYLFLMAEFDNYRKRVLREKADMLKNAAEKTLLGILPVVDDFERGMAATDKIDAENSVALSLREGMELI
ncbi:MAG: nucleotide exchange factor GrpE, partial [Muribaculaceae bacterium]